MIGLSLEDRLTIIAIHDAPWQHRIGDILRQDDLRREMNGLVTSYRENIEKNYGLFCHAQGKAREEDLDDVLYRPLFFLPFGAAKLISLIVVDDVDPIRHVAAGIGSIAEMCIASEPCYSHKDTTNARCFVSFPSLLSEYTGDSYQEDFGKALPTLFFCRMKLDGILTLGAGISGLAAAFRAIHSTIDDTITLLLECANHGIDKKFYSTEDVEAARVSLFSLEGPEEIGLTIFGTNPSISLVLLTALRRLQFINLEQSPEGRQALALINDNHAIQQLLGLFHELRPNLDHENIQKFNGMFRWSESTLAIHPSAVKSENSGSLRGKALAEIGVQLVSGGRASAEEKLRQLGIGVTDFFGCPVGAFDLLVRPSSNKMSPIKTTVEKTMDVCELLLLGMDAPATEVSTSLIIPFPDGIRERIDKSPQEIKRIDVLQTVLPELRKRLFSTPGSVLNIKNLTKKGRVYRLPLELRRTVKFVFEEFGRAIANPRLFDTAIDLFDPICALHSTLSDHLPSKVKSELANEPHTWVGALDRGRSEQIAEFINVAYHALQERTAHEYATGPFRSTDLNAGKSVTQLRAAANASFKSGLGLFRREKYDGKRGSVGGLICHGVEAPTTCEFLQLGVQENVQLLLMRIPGSHLVQLSGHLDLLHESFHCLYDASLENQNMNPLEAAASSANSEVFSHVLVCSYVFPDSPMRFARLQLVELGKRLAHQDQTAIFELCEHLTRIFIAIEIIEILRKPSTTIPINDDGLSRVLERFTIFIDIEVAPVLPLWGDYWNSGRRGRIAAVELLKQMYLPIIEGLRAEERAWEHLSNAVAGTATFQADNEMNELKISPSIDLLHEFNHHLTAGVALDRRSPELLSKFREFNESECDGDGIRALTTVCSVLNSYFQHVDDIKFGDRLYMDRDTKSGDIAFTNGHSRNSLQIDQGAAAMFCCIPLRRRSRLREQLASIKTIWGVSTGLRARRLSDAITLSGRKSNSSGRRWTKKLAGGGQ